jgi:Right handed beta helix region
MRADVVHRGSALLFPATDTAKMKHLALLRSLATLLAVSLLPAAAAGRVYYVDPTGSDANQGAESQPLQTISQAARQAQAGDLVVVNPGTYRESVTVTRSGEAGAPIIFRGLAGAVLASPNPASSLSAFDLSGGVGFVTVQGFELTGGFAETVFVRPGAHEVELAGLHIHDNHSGIWIAGASNLVVRDCVIDHNFRTGIRIFAGAHHLRIVDTRAEANDDGLGCEGDSDGFSADPSTSDIEFQRASAIGNSEDGFDLQGPSVTLRQVIARGNGCSGVKIMAGGYLENLLVEQSRIAINVNAPPGATTVVSSCTLWANSIGVRASGADHTLVVRNSIIAGPAKALSVPASVALLEDHNILHRPLSTDQLIVRPGENGNEGYSGDDINCGAWGRASGQGTSTVARDPRLRLDDGQPETDSDAIDSGDNVGAPLVDLVGTHRPVGLGVDRGAFEWTLPLPVLRVRRVLMQADSTGAGALHLQAETRIPVGAAFDPLTDAVAVSLRSGRGDVIHAYIPPEAWRRSLSAHGMQLRAELQNTTQRAVRLALLVDLDRVRLRLSARGADVWACDGTGLHLTIDLGSVRASGEAPGTVGRRSSCGHTVSVTRAMNNR